jgi:hypothetical protein
LNPAIRSGSIQSCKPLPPLGIGSLVPASTLTHPRTSPPIGHRGTICDTRLDSDGFAPRFTRAQPAASKDRKLSDDDITRHERVVAITATIRLMPEIRKAIPKWPVS